MDKPLKIDHIPLLPKFDSRVCKLVNKCLVTLADNLSDYLL